MSERWRVTNSTHFTDWDDLRKLLYVLHRAELRAKSQKAWTP